jgi:hypothetical protein
VPYNLWLSEAAVLSLGVTLGLTFLGYVRAVRMLRVALAEPGLAGLVPRLEHVVNVHRFAIAFMAMALLVVVRIHLGHLGVHPFALPAE